MNRAYEIGAASAQARARFGDPPVIVRVRAPLLYEAVRVLGEHLRPPVTMLRTRRTKSGVVRRGSCRATFRGVALRRRRIGNALERRGLIKGN